MDDELRKFGDTINEANYSDFLQGKLWDDTMNTIDYDDVTPKIEDYLLGASKYNQRWEGTIYDNTNDKTHAIGHNNTH